MKSDRKKSAGSKKIGCTAVLDAKEKLGEEQVFVSFTSHTKHVVNSRFTWQQGVLPPFVAAWLRMTIENGTTWAHFNNKLRQDAHDAKICATDKMKRKNEPVLVSDTVRITYQDFQNIRRKYRNQEVGLVPDYPSSLEKCENTISPLSI